MEPQPGVARTLASWANRLSLVDAGMRQLNSSGWMHNRLRMVTSQFLVKHLFINWREGERYFMQNLVDGDLAANNGGWQWSVHRHRCGALFPHVQPNQAGGTL